MRYLARFFSFSLASSALLLSGCVTGIQDTGGITTATSALGASAIPISGSVHGGQQPIFNATVRLYSVGSTGYGTGSTLLATSLPTNAGGTFAFTKNVTNGASTGITPVWACPTTGNPIIYITAVGGNTQGTGTTATNNTAAAVMAVLGPCSGLTSTTPVALNEITTVGSVFAMAQYINPGTTAGSMTMGTSATTQGNTGIVNAAASIANLVDIAGGGVASPRSFPGTAASVSGITVTATPEQLKIVTLANILGSCINQASATSFTNCPDLFANALPPVLASATSQPAATFGTPVDTIQAAYYLATNPAALGTFTSCNQSGVTTTMNCLFGLQAGIGAPFVGGLTAVPSDWTLGITYTATGTCTGGGAFFAGPTKAAVDASGNLWFVNGVGSAPSSGVYANLAELSPVGAPLLCLGGSSNGRGVSIDPTGNVWASFNTATPSNAIFELPLGGSSLITWPAATADGTKFTPYTVSSDGLGNIYFTSSPTSSYGDLLYFPTPGASTTPFAANLAASAVTGTASATPSLNTLASDSANHMFISTLSAPDLIEYLPTTAAVGLTTIKTSYGLAIDANNYVYQGQVNATGTTYKALEKTLPGISGVGTFATSSTFLGGINGVRSVQVDGAGNAWVGNEFSSTGPYTTVANFPLVEIASTTIPGSTASTFVANTTFTALSPTPSAATITQLASATYCTSTTTSTSPGCPTGGGFIKNDFQEMRDIGIDPSGNVWALNTGSESVYSGASITEVIGAAVPVSTPLSLAIKNGSLAQKP